MIPKNIGVLRAFLINTLVYLYATLVLASCVELRELKTASITGRKRLNDVTKSFRSKTKEEQLLMSTDLLTAYQEEVDQLSRRSKFAEMAFFSLYKSLSEAPDPCNAIDALINMVTSTSSHQLEIEKLRGELSEFMLLVYEGVIHNFETIAALRRSDGFIFCCLFA